MEPNNLCLANINICFKDKELKTRTTLKNTVIGLSKMGKEEEKQRERGLKKVYDNMDPFSAWKNEFEIHNSIYKRWTTKFQAKREKIHTEIYFEQWGFYFYLVPITVWIGFYTNNSYWQTKIKVFFYNQISCDQTFPPI